MIKIFHENKILTPVVVKEIIWQTDIKNYPSSLKFNILLNSPSEISNGDRVIFSFKGKNIFSGYIFSIKFDKENIFFITAYDQIRYLKNSDTKVFENTTASKIFSSICGEYGLKVGQIDDTEYLIPSLTRTNAGLLDIIEYSLSITKKFTGKEYIIFDDCGNLCLKNIEDMLVPFIIHGGNSENFFCKKEIDTDTYNQIKLVKDSSKEGKREVTIIKDEDNIKKWGILQYYGKAQKYENALIKAKGIMNSKNRETERFSVENILGESDIRAGSRVFTDLRGTKEIITVKKAVHHFFEGQHLMSLEALI